MAFNYEAIGRQEESKKPEVLASIEAIGTFRSKKRREPGEVLEDQFVEFVRQCPKIPAIDKKKVIDVVRELRSGQDAQWSTVIFSGDGYKVVFKGFHYQNFPGVYALEIVKD